MLDRLLACPAPDPTQARQGRLLNGLLLSFIVLSLLSYVVYRLFSGTGSASPVTLIGAAAFLGLYYFTRRGGVRWTAWILLALLILLITALSTGEGPSGRLSTLLTPLTLVVPIALAGALLDWRAVLPIGLLVSADISWLFISGMPPLRTYRLEHADDVPLLLLTAILLFVAVGALTAFSSAQIQHALDALHQQNQTLLTQQTHAQTLVMRMQATARQISQSATELAATAAQQARHAANQESAVAEASTTLEQLTQTAGQITDSAAGVAGAAAQALVSANEGQEAVRDSIMGMAMIKTRVNDITTRILALSEQSQRITEIVDLIATIAAQTHILALNAAVESAGAGEAGQRFGVVAAEVKKLAQRSVAATKDVRGLVGQIQAAAAAAVMATEEGLKETDRGVSLAHQSGAANEDIIRMVEDTAELAQAISLATQQQRTASEQTVATMYEVADVSRQTASSSQQIQEAVAHLSAVAQDLETVPEPPPPPLPARSAPPPWGRMRRAPRAPRAPLPAR